MMASGSKPAWREPLDKSNESDGLTAWRSGGELVQNTLLNQPARETQAARLARFG